MDQTHSQSALNTAAAALRGMWAAMCSGFGLWGADPDDQAVADWVNGIFRRLEELLAGQALGACDVSRAADFQQASGARAVPMRAAGAARDGGNAGGIATSPADFTAVVAGVGGAYAVCIRQLAFGATAQFLRTARGTQEVLALLAAPRDFGRSKASFFEKWVEGALKSCADIVPVCYQIWGWLAVIPSESAKTMILAALRTRFPLALRFGRVWRFDAGSGRSGQ